MARVRAFPLVAYMPIITMNPTSTAIDANLAALPDDGVSISLLFEWN
ncbi:MAG: hypothetical protein WCE47_06230 [Gaiella sp.]